MRRVSLIGAEVLLLFLGVVAPSHARQDQHEQGSRAPKQDQQAKPERQQQAKPEEQKQAKPQAQQQKPQTQTKPARQEQRQQPKAQPEQAKSNGKQQEQQKQANNQQERAGKQRQQSASLRPPQRTQEEQTRRRAEPSLRLSAMGKSRIPDARFRSNFGRTHEFRIGEPRLVNGYSRFQYGGYWFGFVQPWPLDWYYTDNVYVDYISGRYYLCNPYYPGVHIAITVVV
jgi:hypothetical protein